MAAAHQLHSDKNLVNQCTKKHNLQNFATIIKLVHTIKLCNCYLICLFIVYVCFAFLFYVDFTLAVLLRKILNSKILKSVRKKKTENNLAMEIHCILPRLHSDVFLALAKLK